MRIIMLWICLFLGVTSIQVKDMRSWQASRTITWRKRICPLQKREPESRLCGLNQPTFKQFCFAYQSGTHPTPVGKLPRLKISHSVALWSPAKPGYPELRRAYMPRWQHGNGRNVIPPWLGSGPTTKRFCITED